MTEMTLETARRIARGMAPKASMQEIVAANVVLEDEIQRLSVVHHELLNARLETHGFAPGYRDITLYFYDQVTRARATVRLADPSDTESLLRYIRNVHECAWQDGAPIDCKPGERRPSWMEKKA
jgi:hypothetical protein